MIKYSNSSLREALATRQSIKIITATLAKTATRWVNAVNVLSPLRTLPCNKNWMTHSGQVMTILVLGVFFSTQAWSCVDPPSGSVNMAHELVLRSDSIVLARVIEENVNENIEKDKIKDVVYKFELIENIKGNVEKPIIINGYNISNDNDHNLHAEPKFWEQGWFGSAPISVNCEMMIGFNPDISYLLFLDKP